MLPWSEIKIPAWNVSGLHKSVRADGSLRYNDLVILVKQQDNKNFAFKVL